MLVFTVIFLYEFFKIAFIAYIIKWNFQIFRTGIRHLKGGKSKQDDVGKDRIFFFFWQGKDCSASDKGTAALMTVEMDTEEGPQVNKFVEISDSCQVIWSYLFGCKPVCVASKQVRSMQY